MKYLGVDWGEKRIGLALADSETRLATPFKTISNIGEIMRIIETEDIGVVVLGKPCQISNFQFPVSKQFNNFLNELKQKLVIPIELADERLSSKAADALSGGQKVRASRDEIAAMLILQCYLDKKYGSDLQS